MKKIVLLILLNILCFGQNIENENQKINDFLNKSQSLLTIKKINVWHNSTDNPGVFKIEVDMYNKKNELVSFNVYQEINVPITDCTFKVERINGLLYLNFDYSYKVNNLLSEEGKYKMITNIFYKIESQLNYIYNQGE